LRRENEIFAPRHLRLLKAYKIVSGTPVLTVSAIMPMAPADRCTIWCNRIMFATWPQSAAGRPSIQIFEIVRTQSLFADAKALILPFTILNQVMRPLMNLSLCGDPPE
jgi:hypothetical protein